MKTLLPALKSYLERELLITNAGPDIVDGRVIRTIDIKPEIWVRSSLSAIAYPAIFIWEDGDSMSAGVSDNSRTDNLRVTITVIFQSNDQNYALFDANFGVFAIYDQIKVLLGKNKTLKDANGDNPVCTGMLPTIRSQAFQYPKQGSLYVIGKVFLIEYEREFIKWHSKRMDENNPIIMRNESALNLSAFTHFE